MKLRLFCALAAAGLLALPARAETDTDGGGSPSAALAATARIDFVLNMGKFLFFRMGTGAYPTASGTIDTVSFSMVPSIPGGPTVPGATANNVGVPWNAAAPTYSTNVLNNVVPVEVRSNAGPISIRATVSTPLASGVNTIPFSQIAIASNSVDLPAPLIPNTGTSPVAANVNATAYGNRVTQRSANWTFSFNPVAPPVAGVYSGQVSFTASSP